MSSYRLLPYASPCYPIRLIRYTWDHRILIRQHVAHAPTLHSDAGAREAIVRRHRQLFLSRFPELGEVAFAHSWSGLISVSRNGAPLWGQFGADLYAALGCNGAGISKQTMAGGFDPIDPDTFSRLGL